MNKNEGKIKKKIITKEIDQDWKGNILIQRLQMKHKKVKNINYKLFLISLERKSAKSSRYEAGDTLKMLEPCIMKRPNFCGEKV